MSATFHAWNMLPPVMALMSSVTTNSTPTAKPSRGQPQAGEAVLGDEHRPAVRVVVGRSVLRKSIDCVTSVIFRAMPTLPMTHIQKIAPGPPRLTATATPPMLPRPTVALSAVERAWKWLIAPGSFLSSYLPRDDGLTPWVRARHWPKKLQIGEEHADDDEQCRAPSRPTGRR